jgi:hypothetical protein
MPPGLTTDDALLTALRQYDCVHETLGQGACGICPTCVAHHAADRLVMQHTLLEASWTIRDHLVDLYQREHAQRVQAEAALQEKSA